MTRTQTAEQECGDLARIVVDQPFECTCRKYQNSTEWDHKMRTFLCAMCWNEILNVLLELGQEAEKAQCQGGLSRSGMAGSAVMRPTTREPRAHSAQRVRRPDLFHERRVRLHFEHEKSDHSRLRAEATRPDETTSRISEEPFRLAGQYEEFTEREGNSCWVADDRLMAAMVWLMPKQIR